MTRTDLLALALMMAHPDKRIVVVSPRDRCAARRGFNLDRFDLDLARR